MPRLNWCLIVLALTTAAWDSPAPDVVLYCTPAMAAPLSLVAQRYTQASQVEVHLFTAPPDGLLGLLSHRARDDVVVADAPTMQALAAHHLVRPETLATLGRDPFVLIAANARAAGPPPPGIGVAQLLAAHETVVPDPTTAASFDGAAVLHAAFADAAPRTIGVADTPAVVAQVRADGRLLGLVHQTEGRQPGILTAAILPVAPTVMSGALVVQGQSGQAAGLLAFIAGPEGGQILRAGGLEPGS